MNKKEISNVINGALLLTVAGIISKILGATYRIPLQNLTGDIGFYMYQQVYPLIGISMVLTLYGYPQAVSKMVAENRHNGQPNSLSKVYVPITIVLIGMNAVFALFLYGLAPTFANWVGDEQLTNVYRSFTVILLVSPVLAVFRGVYQAHENMMFTAMSQVVEQIIRVGIIITGAYLIFISELPDVAIGYIGVLATFVGMITAILVWFLLKQKGNVYQTSRATSVPWGYYIRTCLSLGLVAAMGHMILLMLQVVDVFTIVPGLLRGGISEFVAKTLKGIFDRGQVLIQFGAVFGSSFALALVPTVVKGLHQSKHAIEEALQMTLYISGAASLGLVLLIPQVNTLLFKTTDGDMSLRILMLSVMLTALSITIASILQNKGHVYAVACCVLIAIMIKVGMNVLLVPHFQLVGSALGTVVSLLCLFLLLSVMLRRNLPSIQWMTSKNWFYFIIALCMMGGGIIIVQWLIPLATLSRIGLLVFVLLTVTGGALLYLSILVFFGVLSKQQLQMLPFGNRFYQMDEWLRNRKGR